jgi:hypothetical protein
MNPPNYHLILGGAASLLIALLHIVLAIRPQIWSYFGADELAQMHQNGSPFTVFVSIGLALMFAAWGVYALSGAGLIKPLPLLKAILITIGIIYILRGLMLPSEIIEVLRAGHSFRFVIMSTGCLAIGILHLVGSTARLGG